MKSDEIRCGRDFDGNKTSIRIKLQNNDKLYAQDFAHHQSYDFFSLIIKERSTAFGEVINYIKAELQIQDCYEDRQRHDAFGGFYKKLRLRNSGENVLKTYSLSDLAQYYRGTFTRFLKDNISFEAQQFFDLRYDPESQRIIIPIYNSIGQIIGAKGRANWEMSEDDIKYLYLIPCRVSETLYGYSHNFEHLTDNNVYICESEKSVMQAYSYGVRNVVALGGNALHKAQCKLLIELYPKNIIFLLDNGLDLNITMGNIKLLQKYTKMFDIGIGYWDYRLSKSLPEKCSPTDLGADKLNEILKNKIVFV